MGCTVIGDRFGSVVGWRRLGFGLWVLVLDLKIWVMGFGYWALGF